MEATLIQRYCSIEGTFCKREVPYQGDWTYFFAYSGLPYWSEFAKDLENKLSERGIEGERWQDTVRGDLIFMKVCGGIHAHDLILAEASLSYLELGLPPPHSSWGGMLCGSTEQVMLVAPWLMITPGVAIMLLVLAFSLVGDTLRDMWDPRLRGR